MEDFLKNKLSEYTPPFKEEYWTSVQVELKKRRKRRLLLLWWSGGLSSLLLALLIYLTATWSTTSKSIRTPSSEIKVHTDHIELSGEKSANSSANSKSYSTANSTATGIATGNTTTNFNSNKTKSSQSSVLSGSKSPHQNQDLSPTKGLLPTTKDKRSTTQATNDEGQLIMIPTDRIIENQNTRSDSSHIEWSHSDKFFPISSIGVSKILPFELKPSLPTLKEIEQVHIKISQQQFGRRPISFTLAASALGNSVYGFIHNEEIRIQHQFTIGANGFYLQAGVGAGRYGGEFAAIDHASVTYRSFASNSQSQTLIPTSAYYVNLPIEFGLRASRWNMGLNLNPEYLLGIHGKIMTEEINSSIIPSETITLSSPYEIERSRSQSEKSSWLDQSNIRELSIPIGFSLEYRIREHWSIGASACIYPSGLYRFKNPVLNHNSASGNKEQFKGGLYVSYKF
jgi:hypothetical protein